MKPLTQRDCDLLAMLVDGLSNKQIGRLLGVTERWAAMCLSTLYIKINVRSRTQAAVWWWWETEGRAKDAALRYDRPWPR